MGAVQHNRILLIDDDQDLSMIVRDTLLSYGYEVTFAKSSEEAFEVLTKEKFHLIVLDINLPDGTGFDICKEIRQVSNVPVVFASARTSEDDKIEGLDIGGDDYLAKPYSLKELLYRIKALLRRAYHEEQQEKIYHLNSQVTVNCSARQVVRQGQELKLALKEFDLLQYLCEHPNRAIPKEELLSEVWGVFSEAEIATVAVHVRWLREKIEENPAKPTCLKTVWGVGYQLVMQEENNEEGSC